MAKALKYNGEIVERTSDDKGFAYSTDKNGQPCWDMHNPQRVILATDLRRYAPGLHIGQLGWTVPSGEPSYDRAMVVFDHGVSLEILSYSISQVLPERAEEISAAWIAKHCNTPDDADPVVAEQCRQQLILNHYSKFVACDQMVELGSGPDEVYAFTFPSLRRLAELEGKAYYPIKIGCAKFGPGKDGALTRICQMILDQAGYPERAEILLVFRTLNSRALETQVHRHFKELGRHKPDAIGREWFYSTAEEVIETCKSLSSC